MLNMTNNVLNIRFSEQDREFLFGYSSFYGKGGAVV
jgi:hypothetical protein